MLECSGSKLGGTSGGNSKPKVDILVGVSSTVSNSNRRKAVRNSWFKYASQGSCNSSSSEGGEQCIETKFIVSNLRNPAVNKEGEDFGDLVQLEVPEGYGNLWRKLIAFCKWASLNRKFRYLMHADDDSFVRLDLIMELMNSWPSERFYWGYVWNLTPESSQTAPIRTPLNKSHMPHEQYQLEYYPPFASGCCFVLSYDLIEALSSAQLPDYRVMDPPFGIHLCGKEMCILKDPIVPVHEPRVRPYRPLPLFRMDTLCQHYMFPEEMRGYYERALLSAQKKSGSCSENNSADEESTSAAGELYATLVELGVLRR